MRARLEGPPRHVAMGLLREERGDGAVRAHAAAVSTAGPGAAAKTIRMHNEPVEPNRCPPLGLSLYKDRRHSKGGSSSSHGVRVSPPTAYRVLYCGHLQAGGRAGAVMCLRVVWYKTTVVGHAVLVTILKRSQRAASCSLSPRVRISFSAPGGRRLSTSCFGRLVLRRSGGPRPANW